MTAFEKGLSPAQREAREAARRNLGGVSEWKFTLTAPANLDRDTPAWESVLAHGRTTWEIGLRGAGYVPLAEPALTQEGLWKIPAVPEQAGPYDEDAVEVPEFDYVPVGPLLPEPPREHPDVWWLVWIGPVRKAL